MNFRITSGQVKGPAIDEQLTQEQRFNRASRFLSEGNAAEALQVCERSLRKFPGDANLMVLAAKASLALRRVDRVKPLLEEAIRLYPDFAGAHETLGDFYLVQGRPAEAKRAYEQAMRLDPTRALIHQKIARAGDQAAQPAGGAERGDTGQRERMASESEIRRAVELERDGDPRAAEMIYRDILTRDPDHVEAARLLAKIAVQNKHYRDAQVFLKKALQKAPDYLRALVDLANVQRELDDFAAMVETASRVVELSPERAESHVLYAGAIGHAGNHEAAIEAYETALSIAPDKAGAICGMSHHLKTIGRTDEAIAGYRRAIEVRPNHAESYWSLANLKTFRFEPYEVEAMEALLDEAELADEPRAQLHNALGLSYESDGDYASAFHHFEQCNAARRRLESYDPVATEAQTDRTIELLDRPFIDAHLGAPPQDVTPIFVVGLPRSGSTLIEQILASHSQVEGTHELSDLNRAIKAARKLKRGQRHPEQLADLSVDEWAGIGQDYLARTEQYRSGLPYFVDKNPNNFTYVGFLKLALPNAKVIDARRHPMDSCFGTFKQLFASGQPFSYDLEEVGEYYLQYRRLMEHWHKVVPGFVLEVNYESVVADLEAEVRRLLDFCGLPFEDACLRFHETERAVKTASAQQVRQPIYKTSVDLWRNYEQQLEPLLGVLEPVLRDRPEDGQSGASA